MQCSQFSMHQNQPCLPLHSHHAAAGVIAIDLARQTLQQLPNSYVLVVSTENLTRNWWVTD